MDEAHATSVESELATMGAVNTCLLRHPTPVSARLAGELLNFTVGEPVRIFERPIPHATSPERLTGVDCHLASAGQAVRAVGTVVSRTSITGGHVLQGSAYVRVLRGAAARQPWSHYLARPGAVETMGKVDAGWLAEGFLDGRAGAALLDLEAIARRALERVQNSELLQRQPPFKNQRTTLRWLVAPGADAITTVTYRVGRDLSRTFVLPRRDISLRATVALCEDLALHDWLLTTLASMVDRAPIGSGDRAAVVRRLEPALDFLLHLWMPAARVAPGYATLWAALERRLGLSRQWESLSGRVHDQLVLAAVTGLRTGPVPDAGRPAPTATSP